MRYQNTRLNGATNGKIFIDKGKALVRSCNCRAAAAAATVSCSSFHSPVSCPRLEIVGHDCAAGS